VESGRRTLIERVWPKGRSRINQPARPDLGAALDRGDPGRRFIANVPRRGYGFVVYVGRDPDEAGCAEVCDARRAWGLANVQVIGRFVPDLCTSQGDVAHIYYSSSSALRGFALSWNRQEGSCGPPRPRKTKVILDAHRRPCLAVCVAVLVGTAVHLVNGILVGTLRVMPFVVTLVLVTFLRDLSDQLSDGGSIAGLSPDLAWLGRYNWGLLPSSVGIALIVPFRAVFGRHRHQHQNKLYHYQKTTLPPQAGS
jgi:hypothetical protein